MNLDIKLILLIIMQQFFTAESITTAMKKTNKTKKTKTLCKEEVYDNKRCILLWKQSEYGLTILTMKNAKGSELYGKPIFYIPLRTFMSCGAFWSALHLCTIFWEPKPYNIERSFQETERIKGAYLIEFATDMAPICKGWARQCIERLHKWPRNPETEEVFVEIIVFEDSLKDKLMDAIDKHALQVSEVDKRGIFNIFES
jgi:hypothetical protein